LNDRSINITYRLPTEAEWEYAARGGNKGTQSLYAGGNDLDQVGWFTENSGGKTHPVRRKAANELGLYDMTGNVWEWCSDWYSDYSDAQLINPKGKTSGIAKVRRGGSWGLNARNCRLSSRNESEPDYRNNILGFRLAADLK